MKKNIFLILLFCLMLINQFTSSLRAQIFSEAPVTISDKGERLSNMIYVKFKPSDLINIPNGKKDVDGNFISNKFSNIKKTFSDFCKNRQLDLPDLKISKAIANAKDEDTLFIDVKTAEIKKLPNLARVFIIKFPKQVDIETITSELSKQKEVEYAHGPVQLVDCAEYPNDQYYANGGQWYLNTISAPNAWGITKGSPDIKIALIEKSGVELTHSDLQSKIAGGDNNPAGIIGPHGTNVAGFAGAETNINSRGVASLGWNVKLLTYQRNNDDINRTVLAQKIKDAADAGAQVINLSFKTIKEGFTSCSALFKSNGSTLTRYYYYNWDYSLVRDAITYAVGKNSVVVASAGNSTAYGDVLPCENIPYPCYPAQYPNVIAVSGSQQNNNFVDGWNYGSFVAVNAPGRTDANTGLWSTDINNSFTNDILKTSGTSFSAPQVSALAALIKSVNNSLTPAQVKTIVENTADKVGQYSYANGRNDYFGYGRINAYAALKYTVEHFGGTFNQNVTIPAGDTWNLQPGVILTFASGASLIVNGTLSAVGNSSSGITFSRSGASGTWGGIQFNSGSSGNLQYCTIQYAANGIYCYHSSPYIAYCHIQNNQYTGIYCQYYSSPSLYWNTIQYNYAGIVCSDHCSPNMLGNGYYPGYNVIRNNGSWGISASYYSNPVVGSGSSYGGQNSIYSNGAGTSAISATDYCTINAQKDWWNYTIYPYYSDTYFYTSASTITANPGLSSDPNSGRAMVVPTDKQGIAETTSLSVQRGDDDLANALDKQKDKKYDEAIPLFLNVFKNHKDELLGKYALCKIEECFTQAGKKDYQTYSDNEIKSLIKEGNETYALALDLGTHQFANSGFYKSAINNLLLILQKNNVNAAIEKNTLFTLGSFYHLFLGDEISSDTYFEELKRKYPNDELVNQISIIKGLSVESNDLVQNAQLVPTEETISPHEQNNRMVISNYPNPFNPTTKISFSLPLKSQIKLKVFDVLGREIQILADGVYGAGKHEVEFNAINLPSGVYFYNLTTGSNSVTKKMLLMK